MALHVDSLLDRLQLKSKLRFWRVLSLLLVVLCIGLVARGGHGSKSGGFGSGMKAHIARLSIDGVITEDRERRELIADLAEDKNVKAVILSIDSPGGTAAGGESLYLALRELGAKKPLVAVMEGMAASGGYMTALSADRIYAREGTLTGSIGVILEMAEFTELAKKLGIEPITVKSGPFKGAPTPLEKFTPEQRASIQRVIDRFHLYFKTMTAERRHLPMDRVTQLAQGQVYSGAEAVELKLVDALGGEKEAQKWLETEKKIDPKLEIEDAEVPKKDEKIWDKVSAIISGKGLGDVLLKQHGLMTIWQ